MQYQTTFQSQLSFQVYYFIIIIKLSKILSFKLIKSDNIFFLLLKKE